MAVNAVRRFKIYLLATDGGTQETWRGPRAGAADRWTGF
jgi:hypothetical protein